MHSLPLAFPCPQGMSVEEYEAAKERVADELCARLDAVWPGLKGAVTFREVGDVGVGGVADGGGERKVWQGALGAQGRVRATRGGAGGGGRGGGGGP